MGKIEEEIIQYRDQHYTPFETELERLENIITQMESFLLKSKERNKLHRQNLFDEVSANEPE